MMARLIQPVKSIRVSERRSRIAAGASAHNRRPSRLQCGGKCAKRPDSKKQEFELNLFRRQPRIPAMKATKSKRAPNQLSPSRSSYRTGIRRITLGIALLLLLSTRTQAGDAVRSWTWTVEPVTAGETISIWLNLLNPGQNAVSESVPELLPARVEGVEEFLKSTLKLRSAAEMGPVSVAPGGFARREYLFKVPPSLRGAVTLTLTGSVPGRFLLQVLPPPIQRVESPATNLTTKVLKKIIDGEDNGFGRTPIEFFKAHLFPYEPMYFLAGPDSPTARFQISLRYQLLNNDGALAERAPWLRGLSFAYTQTSLWDLAGQSAPFFDSSYKPELLYVLPRVDRGKWADWFRLDLQGGVQHESNGRDGASSRSLNIAYLKPTMKFGRDGGIELALSPKAFVYLPDVVDNPDIALYRGYFGLQSIIGWDRGLQLRTEGRLGNHADRGSVQLDLTYPMSEFLAGSFSVYLHLQFFNGYGESLLQYNQRESHLRLGISLYR